MENSIEEDIKILEEFKTNGYSILLMKYGDRIKTNFKLEKAIEHILSDYKRVLKENKELKISNKEINKECSRLEKKEVELINELINENEHYKDLIYELKTYYEITEEDLEKCMKNDR